MKRILALLAGAAFFATATPALADSYRGYDRDDGYQQSYRDDFRGDRGLRMRVDRVSWELNTAYRQGVIDRGALRRAMSNVNSYRFMLRDGVNGYEARRINFGLDDIERTLERARHRDWRDDRRDNDWRGRSGW